jgi:pimeloyl-ACP methyl ester carboxylesterase
MHGTIHIAIARSTLVMNLEIVNSLPLCTGSRFSNGNSIVPSPDVPVYTLSEFRDTNKEDVMVRGTLIGALLFLVVLLFSPGLTLAGETMTVIAGGDTLYGTLELPGGTAPCPVALIIAGSGPTDRDGNNPMAGTNNSLRFLAEALASRGIASLRFDKRGIGESAGAMTAEVDLRFETYIDDAVLWGQEIRKNERFCSLVVIGHSEGSLIGMIACRKLGADGFVSIAGAGRTASEVLIAQVESKLSSGLLEQTKSILAQLQKGELVESPPPELYVLFRPSVQPYFISWLQYDPAEEIARLEVPALVIQGSTDIQIGVEEAEKLAESYPNAKLLVIDGMNHILKEVPEDLAEQIDAYSNPDLPVALELVEGITAYISANDHNSCYQ